MHVTSGAGRVMTGLRVRAALAGVLAVVLGLVVAPAPALAVGVVTDDVRWIIDDTIHPSPAEVALRLSRAAFHEPVPQVVLATEAGFADALASGPLQQHGPLLLVPPVGPVPEPVLAEIRRLAPDRVVVLGGPAAVGPDVEEQVAELGIPTVRAAGGSRVETAVAVAGLVTEADTQPATTALLVRGFPTPGADPSAAFADALAVGAWAAETGWPVLLTDPTAVSPATAEHLAAGAVERVIIVGGPVAVSPTVEEELRGLDLDVERVMGDSREDTAIAVADRRGHAVADDPAAVVLVEGHLPDAWAGGLASAALAARTGAPLLLASGSVVPQAILSRLSAAEPPVTLTCVAVPAGCLAARAALGLPAAGPAAVDRPDGAVVRPGDLLAISGGFDADRPALADGTCLDGPVPLGAPPAGVRLADPLPSGTCTLTVRVPPPDAPPGGPADTTWSWRFRVLAGRPPGPAWIPVTGTAVPLDLARALVDDRLVVLGARLVGDRLAVGSASRAGQPLGFHDGVVLSTGHVADLAGPNDRPDTTTALGTPGLPSLDALAGRQTHDAAALQVDVVVPAGATGLSLEHVFGSEEYEEFSGTAGDVLSVTIGDHACTLPDGQPVDATTIGPDRNPDRYRPNGDGSLDVELDGLTTVITCDAPAVPGAVVTVTVAIADTGDAFVDSAVVLRAGSLTALGP